MPAPPNSSFMSKCSCGGFGAPPPGERPHVREDLLVGCRSLRGEVGLVEDGARAGERDVVRAQDVDAVDGTNVLTKMSVHPVCSDGEQPDDPADVGEREHHARCGRRR